MRLIQSGGTSCCASHAFTLLAVHARKPAPQRGHVRGKYVDGSRDGAIELGGIPAVGYGVSGVIPGTRLGDSAANLERDEHHEQMRATRARFNTNARHAAGRRLSTSASTAACQTYYPSSQRLTLAQTAWISPRQ